MRCNGLGQIDMFGIMNNVSIDKRTWRQENRTFKRVLFIQIDSLEAL